MVEWVVGVSGDGGGGCGGPIVARRSTQVPNIPCKVAAMTVLPSGTASTTAADVVEWAPIILHLSLDWGECWWSCSFEKYGDTVLVCIYRWKVLVCFAVLRNMGIQY